MNADERKAHEAQVRIKAYEETGMPILYKDDDGLWCVAIEGKQVYQGIDRRDPKNLGKGNATGYGDCQKFATHAAKGYANVPDYRPAEVFDKSET